MDPLTDPKPAARKPRPKFGYLPAPAPDPVNLKVGDMVKYIGPIQQAVLAGAQDLGIIQSGPKTARELGIVHPTVNPDDVFWDVAWAYRTRKPRCWTHQAGIAHIP